MKGSIRQRGNTYTALWSAADPATGKRHQASQGGFKTKREAQTHLNKMLTAVDDGTFVRPTKLTLGAFLVDRWLPTLRNELRPATIALYEGAVTTYIIPRLGGTPLRAITPPQLLAFYAELAESGRAKTGKGLSPRSVQLVHVALNKALRAAVEWDLLPTNPAAKARPPKPPKPEQTVWSGATVRAFLAAAEAENDRLRALWLLAITSGMRRGELLGLRWDDVDLDGAALRIRRARVSVNHAVLESLPKTAKSARSLALDPHTVTVLRSHRKRQLEDRLAAGEAWTETGLLFVDALGEPLHPTSLTRTFKRATARAGLPVVRLHDLRHAYATAALEAGVPLKVVSELLGHASIAVTADIYSHVSEELNRKSVEHVASFILGSAAG